MGTTTPERNIEAKFRADEIAMRKQLDAMPKKSLMIPVDELNPDDKVVPIGVNGIIYGVPRGVYVEVPNVVADVYMESQQKTLEAQRMIDTSTTKEVKVM